MSKVFKIATTLTCHAWSPDRKQIAVCPNNEDVLIYSNCDSDDFAKWKLEHTLKGHDLLVTAIDWSPIHNKIVTCSHDRNAFVWTLTNGEWKPSLSILRINRAALCVKWSPDGKKFAVASGAKVVPVCHYEAQNDWWISKMVKKHKSTVLWVSWHPNSQLLATSSSDFRCRVFSAYIPEVDGGGCDSILCGNTSKTAFGDLLAEYDGSNGWVESCAWAPGGHTLAYVGHDASVNIVEWDAKKPVDEPKTTTFKEKNLPDTVCLFLNDLVLVVAGYELNPRIYQYPGPNRGGWKALGTLEKAPNGGKKEEKTAEVGPGNMAGTKALWQTKIAKGVESAASDSATLWTKHTNSIVDIKPYGDVLYAKLDSFSTCGLDGNVVVWVGKDFKAKVEGLNL